MSRHKDTDWNLACPGKDTKGGCQHSAESVTNHLLMDIRDRLDVLRCVDFLAIPSELKAIRRKLDELRRARCHRKHVSRMRT